MVVFGIKKFVKQDINQQIMQTYLPDLIGSTYFYGRIGGGKTTSLMSTAQKYHDAKGFKIFDIYGGERNEHLYWCFPSQDKGYWDAAKKLLNLDKDGPKQYKVNLVYPYYKSKMPKKLPSSLPNVKSTVFTIPMSSIDVDDIYLATGLLSDSDKFVLRQVMDNIGKKDGPRKILHEAKKHSTKVQSIYRNFLLPLTSNLLIQNDRANTNFEIKNELKDRETITVLCTEFVPKEFRLFVIGWFVRQLSKQLDNTPRLTKNILIMREAAEFFRATDDSVMPDTYKIFRKQLSNFLRYGRKGLHFFLDAQSPRETRGLVDGQQDLTILCKLPGENDRLDATEQLKRDGLISQKQVSKLATLNPGQIMFCESGKTAKLRYVSLPRTMYWKPGNGNFYKHLWVKLNDGWKNIEDVTDELSESWKKENAFIEEMEAIAKLKEQQEKEAKKKPKRAEEDEIKQKIPKETSERVYVTSSPDPIIYAEPSNITSVENIYEGEEIII